MARIFIAYARQNVLFATRLARSLSDVGVDVWIDVEDIPSGVKWHNAIQQGLNQCEIMLVVITPESMQSSNVEEEWSYFRLKDKPIIPIWYQPTEVHYKLALLQYVDFYEQDYKTAFTQLHSELRRYGLQLNPIAAQDALVEIPDQRPLPVRGRRKIPWGWILTAVIVPLLIGIVVAAVQVWLERNNNSDSNLITETSTPANQQTAAAMFLTDQALPPATSTPNETATLQAILTELVQTATANGQATMDTYPNTPTHTPTRVPTVTPNLTQMAHAAALETSAVRAMTDEVATQNAQLTVHAPTNTSHPTVTPTNTATPSKTPTLTNTPSPTQAPSPIPDIVTRSWENITLTVAACDFDYQIIEETPANGEFYSANTAYERQIVLLNTGSCAWERNTSFMFVAEEDFDARPIFIRERINPSEELVICFRGTTPRTGGLYTGTWELRTPGQIIIGEPFRISVNVFETNAPLEIRVCDS